MSLNLIKEAILGGYEEAMSMPTPQQRIRRGFVVLQKFCGEVVGILKTVPYGVRCLRTYKRTPPTHQSVSYGSHERHSLDLYVPTPSDSRPDVQQPRLQNPSEVGAEKGITGPQHHILQVLQSDAKEQDGSGELPVVIFVPGNVWAASEKWQYAFFAKRLQNEGFLTAILDYPLYPQVHGTTLGVVLTIMHEREGDIYLIATLWQAKIEEMVASVGEAIVWMQHNAETFGGNKHRICVVGQSAGTQLTSMWLLEQSKRLADGASSSYSLSSTTLPVVDVSPMENGSILDSSLESTMASGTEKHPGALAKPVEMEGIPAAFLAMNGVYELEQHYRYEQSRGVAGISMMKRCMRGDLAKWSPSVRGVTPHHCWSPPACFTTSKSLSVVESLNGLGSVGLSDERCTVHEGYPNATAADISSGHICTWEARHYGSVLPE